jgi:hypothetical protein
MYIPSHFEELRPEILHDFIEVHPFGALITHGIDGLDANHIPFELDVNCGEYGLLRAHVARNNPLWQSITNGEEILVIFRSVVQCSMKRECINYQYTVKTSAHRKTTISPNILGDVFGSSNRIRACLARLEERSRIDARAAVL